MKPTKPNPIKWLISLANLIYPEVCQGCQSVLLEQEEWLCLQCESDFPLSPFLLHNENPVTSLFRGRMKLEFGTSFMTFSKGGLAQKLMHKIKYKGRKDLAYKLGQRFGESLQTVKKPDALVPVPLHPKKLKKRGFNQSDHIALGLSDSLGIPMRNDLISRNTANKSQTRLNRSDRWLNVRGIFDWCGKPFEGNYIWLVDDTLTTGSTLESCAAAFQERKIRVGVITLAYAE